MNDKVLCVGTLVVDIFVNTIDGVIKPDTGFGADILPREGGNALNVAVSLSRLGYKKGRISLGSVAGNDMYAGWFEKYLREHGIKTIIKKVKGKESNKCLIIGFKSGKRAFVGFHGANDHYLPADVIKALKKVKPGIFYAGETSSLPNVDRKIGAVLAQAKKQGAVTVLDYIISSGKPSKQLFKAAKYVDVFHINDYEAKLLTGTSNIDKALQILLKKGFKFPIITAGEKPLVCSYKGKKYRLPAFKVKYKDGTGAGDAFTAGLIKGLAGMKGRTIDERISGEKKLLSLLAYAGAAGAAAVTEVGCTAGVTVRNVRRILEA